ncbi:MAG TPA: hypothetical protein DCP92_21870 [Nitrospiraceae bacterium]|jgi:hypothetical protein|nr:hypothetical protein [Nitrospiraceae bacterium]
MPREEEKPLPKPPSTPFGRKKGFERSDEEIPLMADNIAAAMAEGTLDEFLRQEMPDNEHARKLAMMMMAMTGMSPPEDIPNREEPDGQPKTSEAGEPSQEMPFAVGPAEDVFKAVREGDVQGLMGLLAKEYNARVPGTEASTAGEKKMHPSPDQPMIEKEIIDQLITIASENNLSLDWLITRALRLYVQEYQKTGRL